MRTDEHGRERTRTTAFTAKTNRFHEIRDEAASFSALLSRTVSTDSGKIFHAIFLRSDSGEIDLRRPTEPDVEPEAELNTNYFEEMGILRKNSLDQSREMFSTVFPHQRPTVPVRRRPGPRCRPIPPPAHGRRRSWCRAIFSAPRDVLVRPHHTTSPAQLTGVQGRGSALCQHFHHDVAVGEHAFELLVLTLDEARRPLRAILPQPLATPSPGFDDGGSRSRCRIVSPKLTPCVARILRSGNHALAFAHCRRASL